MKTRKNLLHFVGKHFGHIVGTKYTSQSSGGFSNRMPICFKLMFIAFCYGRYVMSGEPQLLDKETHIIAFGFLYLLGGIR